MQEIHISMRKSKLVCVNPERGLILLTYFYSAHQEPRNTYNERTVSVKKQTKVILNFDEFYFLLSH